MLMRPGARTRRRLCHCPEGPGTGQALHGPVCRPPVPGGASRCSFGPAPSGVFESSRPQTNSCPALAQAQPRVSKNSTALRSVRPDENQGWGPHGRPRSDRAAGSTAARHPGLRLSRGAREAAGSAGQNVAPPATTAACLLSPVVFHFLQGMGCFYH